MSLLKWALIAPLALPAAEIAAFMPVALMRGWVWALCPLLATSFLGLLILKRSGRRDFDRLQSQVARLGFTAMRRDSPGIGSLIGGILLLFPGFITDILGVLLLLPPFRRRLGARKTGARAATAGPARSAVVDLAPEEWRQLSQTAIDGTQRGR